MDDRPDSRSRPTKRSLTRPNPLLDEWQRDPDPERRDALIRAYSFGIPSSGAIDAIGDHAGGRVLEIGAGTGYWARLLHEAGVEVMAFDLDAKPHAERKWFGLTEPWFDVGHGDERVVDEHGDHGLLLVWPTRDEDWAADAVLRFATAGGTTVAFVGEPSGGRTGDDRFHAVLGEVDRCWSCAYNMTTTPCLCGVTPLFVRTAELEIPRWRGCDDRLRLYRRDRDRKPLGSRPEKGRRWRLQRWRE
jgi:hypothetical protein